MNIKCSTVAQANSDPENSPLEGLYRPRGPFPWFVHDFERDTVGWSGDLRYAYLRLLAHIWSQGGIVPNDDGYLAEAAGLNRCRGYREKLAQLRSKLTSISRLIAERFAESSAIELSNRSDPNSEFVTQKRVLRELEKARARSNLAQNAAKKRWSKDDADGMEDEPNSAMPPPPPPSNTVSNTGSISETPRDTPDDRSAAFAAARELFPDHDSAVLVARLIQSEGPVGTISLIEASRRARDPWRYLWGCVKKRAIPGKGRTPKGGNGRSDDNDPLYKAASEIADAFCETCERLFDDHVPWSMRTLREQALRWLKEDLPERIILDVIQRELEAKAQRDPSQAPRVLAYLDRPLERALEAWREEHNLNPDGTYRRLDVPHPEIKRMLDRWDDMAPGPERDALRAQIEARDAELKRQRELERRC